MSSSGTAPAVRLWARSELRHRWVALVLLGVLAGLAAGLAMAAIDGAGRAATAYQRMRAKQLGADAVFFPSQVGVDNADLSKLNQMPEVAAWGGFAAAPGNIDEIPGGNASPLVTVGSGWFDTIERAKVLEGRLPDPTRDDEGVINTAAAKIGKSLGLGVGSVLTWRSLSPEQSAQYPYGDVPPDFDWKQAAGPTVKLHIVGIVRIPAEAVLSFASSPLILSSPGWAAQHLAIGATPPTRQPAANGFFNALVRLKNGAAGVPTFATDVARSYGRNDIPIKDLSDDVKRVQRSLDVERTAVLLFAGAVILAAVVLIGQAFIRSVRAGSENVPVLRAMGLSREGLIGGLVAPHALSIVVAAATAFGSALAFSTRFPVGLAHELDPDLGLHFNWTVLGLGVLATVAGAAGICTLVAWLTVRRLAGERHAGRNQLVGVATRAGASVPAAVGASLALEPAPSRAGATARPALLAAVIGVFGIVGAVTLVGGIDDALHKPERVGQTWDLEAETDLSVEDATKVLAADPQVTGFALRRRLPSVVDGKDAPLYTLQTFEGGIHFVSLSGREPRADDEIALGPNTARAIKAHTGDTVTVGPGGPRLRVVGITLLAQTPHSSFDEGALLTPAAYEKVIGANVSDDEALIAVGKGMSPDAVAGDLAAKGFLASAPLQPPDVANLDQVRSLPLWLAAFLVLLAIGAVAHALLTGVRYRRRELAVLRALGLTPRQAAACVSWQAAVIGVIALAIGIPLGTIVGRQIWRVLADSLSFVYVGPLAGLLVLALIPAALVVLALLALWPARGAARLRTAEVLRTE